MIEMAQKIEQPSEPRHLPSLKNFDGLLHPFVIFHSFRLSFSAMKKIKAKTKTSCDNKSL